MVTEQDRTLEALEIAIQMELDGKEYYTKASQESSNELGKRLLASLAAEEDVHRRKFEEIYETIRNKSAWPTTDFQPDAVPRLEEVRRLNDFYVELVNFAGLQGFPFGMRVVWFPGCRFFSINGPL